MAKRSQDRNRVRARRTSAQPLAASWRPDEDDDEADHQRRGRRRGPRGLLRRYGWQLYVVPMLVAVTVLVFMDTGDGSGPVGTDRLSGSGSTQGAGESPTGEPKATEQPAVPPNPKIPTAKLPNGAPYPHAGEGEFDILPGGSGKRVGSGGELFTYTIEVERGIDLAPYGGNDSFASLVDATLADPRGWAATGQVSVRRIDGESEDPDIRITLATPETVHRSDYCGYSIKYESSCWRSSESRVMINLARWVRGALAFGGDIGSYRKYVINHEIGHAFDNGHVGCAKNGALAPVMMQQTFGVSNDYVALLNDQVGGSGAVEADGKVCHYNPWPNPQARPS